MPPVIAALAVFLTPVFGAAATFVATFIVTTAMSYVISAVFTPSNRGGYSASMRDRQHVIRSSIAPRNIAYGENVSSGPLFFAGSSDAGDGSVNKYLHLVIGLAAHECEAIDEIYLNEVPLGPLSAAGFPTTGEFSKTLPQEAYYTFLAAANATAVYLGEPASSIVYLTAAEETDNFGNPISSNVPFVHTPGATVMILTEPKPYDRLMQIMYVRADTEYGWVRVKKHLGSPDQAADADLIAAMPTKWTANHRLRGITYLYLRLEFSPAKFPTGIPNIKAKFRGKKIYDPRTLTTYYTSNYALCVNDYMREADGLGCTVDDIHQSTLIASANICDEYVAIPGDIQRRYVVNGAVLLDHSPEENLRQLSTAGGGPVPILAGGIFRIMVGAYQVPTVTLTDSDLRGPIKMRPRPKRRDLFNAVKGTYIAGDRGTWQPVDFPIVKNALYKTQDNNEEISCDITLPFTTNAIMAQRLAKITLERARQGIFVDFPCKATGFRVQAGETVMLTMAKFGWTNKVFLIVGWTFNSNSGVDLLLREEAAGIYSWADGEQTPFDLAPDTSLPSAYFVEGISGLDVTSGNAGLVIAGDGTIVARMHVTWMRLQALQAMEGGRIELEYRRTADSVWTQLAPISVSAEDAYIFPVVDKQLYVVRIRSVSWRGATSLWSYVVHTVSGKSAPPPSIDTFSVTNGVFYWPAVTGTPDLAGYRIRFQYGNNDFWGNAAEMHRGLITESPWKPELIPTGDITVMIKATDTSGNESVNTASIRHNFGDPVTENLILTYDDAASGFPGDKTDCTVVAGDLLADDSGTLFWGGDTDPFWPADGALFWPTATYKAATYVTRYTVQHDEAGSRLTLLTDISAASYTIEFRYDTQGLFWGAGDGYFWPDDSAPFWPQPTAWQTWPGAIDQVPHGQIEFRITTQAGTERGTIAALTLQFDVDEESEVIESASISAGGTRLTLTKAYRSIKIVNWSLEDDGGMAVRIKVADKSVAGPLVYGISSGGANVTATGDFLVQGVKG